MPIASNNKDVIITHPKAVWRKFGHSGWVGVPSVDEALALIVERANDDVLPGAVNDFVLSWMCANMNSSPALSSF